MKMESPLEVLSRAASIVQNEESPKLLSITERTANGDTTEEDAIRNSSPPKSPSSPTTWSRDRRSPKRQHSVTEKSFKKLKVNEEEEHYRISRNLYQAALSSSPITTTTYTYRNKSPITVSIERKTRTNCETSSPPPLIAMCEPRKLVISGTPPDYDTLFPRPSVISTSPPATKYLEEYCNKVSSYNKDCMRSCCRNSVPRYSSDVFKNSNISSVLTRDFDLPTVDDHFRKSLGEKYDFSKHVNERPSSVDDHFAKALGTKWYSLEYGRCASS